MMNLPLVVAQIGVDLLGGESTPLKDIADQSEAPSIFSVEGVQTFLETSGKDFLLNVVGAIAIFIIGKWMAKLVLRIVNRIAEKSKVDITLRKFLSNLLYGVMMAFVIIAAINRLGVDTTSLAAIVAAAGLAIGMALQGTLSNFASGVMLVMFKPFAVGDFVELGGSSGVVDEIQIFNTILRTTDNIRIIIPNGAIASDTIRNFSAEATRRVDLVVGCGYNDDLKAVKQFLEQLVASDSRVLSEPAPVVAVNELGDSSVNFVVRPWVRTPDYWGTKWDFLEAVKVGFEERGFTIPYPTQDLNLNQVVAETLPMRDAA
ncbi:MAG: mechanosensitive ion channel family protein [Planctomycetaceae bacterium]